MTLHLRNDRNAWIAAVILCLPAAAIGQELIEEIVVTADFRGRTARTMATSITMLDAEEIERQAVQHFEELILSVPNLNWSGDGNRARYLQIRGIGELEQYEGAPNPSVGFLVDDIDFSGIGAIGTLFDIERVEILRGPQGTRYGANALAGLVYLQSAAPPDTFTGNARVTAAGDSTLAAGVAVGGPVAGRETLAYRVSAHRYAGDGFRHNPYLGRTDTNGRDETSLRGKLTWSHGDDWSFRLNAMHVDIDDGYDAFAIDNSLTMLSDRPGRDAQRSTGAAFRADWHATDAMTVTSLTSYADSRIEFGFDADWGNPDSWAPYTYDFVSDSRRRRETASQEFRIGSARGSDAARVVDWLAGVYLQRLDEELLSTSQGVYVDPFFDFESELDTALTSRYEAVNAAAFGQAGFAIGARGELTFGVRLERRTTDYTDSEGLAVGPGESMIGGELGYTLQLSDETGIYAALSAGYKAGGFNLGPVPEGRRAFDQERLWSAETGLRSAMAGGRLLASASVFYSLRRDQQVRSSFQLVPNDPSSFVFYTDNAARGSNRGLEADLRWIPSDAWEFRAGIGLLDARFDEFESELVGLEGRAQPHAPRHTLALGASYRHPGGLFARMDVNSRAGYYFDVSHDEQAEAATLGHARLGYEAERWAVQLWAKNLFDEVLAVRGFYFGNEPPDFPNELYVRRGDPRQVGITIDARF